MPEGNDPEELVSEADDHRERGNELAQEALGYFLEREGQLYEREEAVGGLMEHLGTDRANATAALNGLVGDVVDPVQQVPHPDGRYVGIIEYVTFPDEGAYGYAHYSDRFGKRLRVVCARCVETKILDERVLNATQGEGSAPVDASWEELLELVSAHYADAHDQSPSEIDPGASLVSGTTMGGNQAWHDGNVSGGTNISIGANQTLNVSPQGAGSGLNADTVDGSDAADLGGSASEGAVWYQVGAYSGFDDVSVVHTVRIQAVGNGKAVFRLRGDGEHADYGGIYLNGAQQCGGVNTTCVVTYAAGDNITAGNHASVNYTITMALDKGI